MDTETNAFLKTKILFLQQQGKRKTRIHYFSIFIFFYFFLYSLRNASFIFPILENSTPSNLWNIIHPSEQINRGSRHNLFPEIPYPVFLSFSLTDY